MRAPCLATCCVRKGAPERGDARRSGFALNGKFLQQSNSPDLTRLRSDLWSRSDLCSFEELRQARKCTN